MVRKYALPLALAGALSGGLEQSVYGQDLANKAPATATHSDSEHQRLMSAYQKINLEDMNKYLDNKEYKGVVDKYGSIAKLFLEGSYEGFTPEERHDISALFGNLAISYAKLNNHSYALTLCDAGIRADSRNAGPHKTAAVIYLRVYKDKQKAAKYLRGFLKNANDKESKEYKQAERIYGSLGYTSSTQKSH